MDGMGDPSGMHNKRPIDKIQGATQGYAAPKSSASDAKILQLLATRSSAIHVHDRGPVPKPVMPGMNHDPNFSLEWGHTVDRDWDTIDDEVLQWMNTQGNVPDGGNATSFAKEMLSDNTLGSSALGSSAGGVSEDIEYASMEGQILGLNGQVPSAAPAPRAKKELAQLSKDQIDEAVQKRKCNWRKYGQKNLRGKRFQGMDRIRCYYKCNYPGCPVRKQIERDIDESDDSAEAKVKMTGEHNHPPLDPIGDSLDDWQTPGPQSHLQAPSVEGHSTQADEIRIPEAPASKDIPEVDKSFVASIHQRNLNFVIVDPTQVDCPIIFASPGFCQLTGYSPEEVQGRNCRFLQGKDTNPDAIRQISKAIQEIKPICMILLNYKKDGSPFWNLLSITPTLNREGKLLSFIGVQMDVSASLTDKSQNLKLVEAMQDNDHQYLVRKAQQEAENVGNGATRTQDAGGRKGETMDSGDSAKSGSE